MKKKLECLILCGGKGRRLGKLGKKYPKSLLKFNNTTILDKLLMKLSKYKINKITLSCHYKYEYFVKYLKNKRYNLPIKCINDGNINILERIKVNLHRTNNDLLVCYADEIANININNLYQKHLNSKKNITITTYKFHSSFGFLFKNKRKLKFVEKPYIGNYNIGYYIFKNEVKDSIKNMKKIENYLNLMCDKNLVNEHLHNGMHITFNTFEEYNKVKQLKI